MLNQEQLNNIKPGDELLFFDVHELEVLKLKVQFYNKNVSFFISGMIVGTRIVTSIDPFFTFPNEEDAATFLLEKSLNFRKQALHLLAEAELRKTS